MRFDPERNCPAICLVCQQELSCRFPTKPFFFNLLNMSIGIYIYIYTCVFVFFLLTIAFGCDVERKKKEKKIQAKMEM